MMTVLCKEKKTIKKINILILNRCFEINNLIYGIFKSEYIK